jgi:hypothetical protein
MNIHSSLERSMSNSKKIFSLCIPRMDYFIQKKDIYIAFERLNFGDIERIDLISIDSYKGEKYKRAFIHFNSWILQDSYLNERLIKGKDIKVVYDFPSFWKISVNKKDIHFQLEMDSNK